MLNKSSLALVAALATATVGIASLAFTPTADARPAWTHHHRPLIRSGRLYNFAPRSNPAPQASAPSTYEPANTGGGSLGYNQHNEIRN